MNTVIISGRITKKPELNTTPGGKHVTDFTVAVNRTKEVADFIRVQAWEKTADIAAQYTDKGSLVNVIGHISTRKYDNKEGKTVFVQEIIVDRIELLSKKTTTEEHSEEAPKAASTEPYKAQFQENEDDFNTGPLLDIASDDLPF